MGFTHGSKAKWWLGSAASPTVLVDYSIYAHEVQLPRAVDSAETSVFGNTFKTYVPGLTDATAAVTGRFDPIIDAILSDLLGVASVDFRYRPQGNTAGLVQFTFSCFLTAYQPASAISDMSGWSAQFQAFTAITRSTI